MATQEVKSKVAAAGIYSDRFELRDKLTQARRSIDDALQAMDAIEWPTNADYDLL